MTHFSFTVTASFLSKTGSGLQLVSQSANQSINQSINQLTNQSINIQSKPRSSERPNRTFRSPRYLLQTRRVRCPMSAPPLFLSYPLNKKKLKTSTKNCTRNLCIFICWLISYLQNITYKRVGTTCSSRASSVSASVKRCICIARLPTKRPHRTLVALWKLRKIRICVTFC